jgi:hypothetical protein
MYRSTQTIFNSFNGLLGLFALSTKFDEGKEKNNLQQPLMDFVDLFYKC